MDIAHGKQNDQKLVYGLSADVIDRLSDYKKEPAWMRVLRHEAFAHFQRLPLPSWGPSLADLSLDSICFYHRPFEQPFASWDAVPEYLKNEFESLGIPLAEQHALAGTGTQYESALLFSQLQAEWAQQGVIFCSMDDAVVQHPEIVKRYFNSVVYADDNRFAALNGAVWSGGSFVYVPSGVHIQMPISAYFRMQQERMGQFERTLIIAEPKSHVHYLEGCSAPLYSSAALHAAVVEIVVHEGAQVRYSTIQNWSRNVYNLVTKRALVHGQGKMEWVDANIGSAVTMKYPSTILCGEGAHGTLLSLAVARDGQKCDAGGKMIHRAPKTHSTITSRTCIQQGGCAHYRAQITVDETASDAHTFMRCDTLLLGQASTEAEVFFSVKGDQAQVGHEATVNPLDDFYLFYLGTRSCDAMQARTLLIHGFVSFVVDELPFEYAVELQRLMAYTIEQDKK